MAITFHGAPCPKGHTERYASSRQCAVCAKAARAATRKKKRQVRAAIHLQARGQVSLVDPDSLLRLPWET